MRSSSLSEVQFEIDTEHFIDRLDFSVFVIALDGSEDDPASKAIAVKTQEQTLFKRSAAGFDKLQWFDKVLIV